MTNASVKNNAVLENNEPLHIVNKTRGAGGTAEGCRASNC